MKGRWTAPAQRTQSLVGPRRFRFLNIEGDLDVLGWDGADPGKLWRYNQHYFDDLVAKGSDERADWHRQLIESWIQGNPPGFGTAWEPYPTSLRIVNWIKWMLAGRSASPAMLHSLAIQSRYLERRLERHLLGNHLFANAKALMFAGLFFEGHEAARWLAIGRGVLRRELAEQVLPDGAHFELSPMYHALALEDALDLINAFEAFGEPSAACAAVSNDLRQAVSRMQEWLAAMTHPDGGIAFFNDTAFGISPAPAVLEEYAQRLGLGARPPRRRGLMADSGYARLDRGDACLIADVARVGPDYIPGHAHADTLSFEFSLGRARIVVNSGVSEYGVGAERLRQRGTAAHNTVVVDGEDSSEVWSGFRVARRARPRDVTLEDRPEAVVLAGAHDGYTRWRHGPLHRRRWILSANNLSIADTLTDARRPAEARFHLHPDVQVEIDDANAGRLILPDGRQLRWKSGTPTHVEPTTWHPGFGESVPNLCLSVPLSEGQADFALMWD